MFCDNVAGVYDIFVNVINRKTHKKLKRIVSSLIGPDDTVLEWACGTGLLSSVSAQSHSSRVSRRTMSSIRRFFGVLRTR